MFEAGGVINVLGRKRVGEGDQGGRWGRVVFSAPFVEYVGKHDGFPSPRGSHVLDDDPSCNLGEPSAAAPHPFQYTN